MKKMKTRTGKIFSGLALMLFSLVALQACKLGASKTEKQGQASPSAKHEVLPPDESLKGESLYQLKTVFTDQDGKAANFGVYEGHPVVASMFYASCPYSCPVLIDQLKRLEKQLPAAEREKARFLLISFDPENDSTAVLQEVMKKHGLDAARWKLLRGGEMQTREIAAILGIKFRKMQEGGINHTALISFLDGKGFIEAQFETERFSAEEGARRLHEIH